MFDILSNISLFFLLISGTKFPMAKMPVLQIDDRIISQSDTICRYLAREFGLYGNTNLDQTTIDEITDVVSDITDKFVKIVQSEEPMKVRFIL